MCSTRNRLCDIIRERKHRLSQVRYYSSYSRLVTGVVAAKLRSPTIKSNSCFYCLVSWGFLSAKLWATKITNKYKEIQELLMNNSREVFCFFSFPFDNSSQWSDLTEEQWSEAAELISPWIADIRPALVATFHTQTRSHTEKKKRSDNAKRHILHGQFSWLNPPPLMGQPSFPLLDVHLSAVS